MEKCLSLSENEREQIRAFKELSIREIGRRIGRNHSLISRFLKDPDGYNTKALSGRPKILSDQEKRKICREAANSTKGLRLNRNVSTPNVFHQTV